MSTPKLRAGLPLAWGTPGPAPEVRIVLALRDGEYLTGIHDPASRSLVREHAHDTMSAAHSDFRERLARGY